MKSRKFILSLFRFAKFVAVHRCPVNVTAYARLKSYAAVLSASGACLEPTETECRGGICFASIMVLSFLLNPVDLFDQPVHIYVLFVQKFRDILRMCCFLTTQEY